MSFLSVPQLNATSTALSLTSEIISEDTLSIFVWAIISGIIVGLIFAILKKITFWLW